MNINNYIYKVKKYIKFLGIIIFGGFLLWLCASFLASYITKIENHMYEIIAIGASIIFINIMFMSLIIRSSIKNIVSNKYLQMLGEIFIIIIFIALYKFMGILEISIK
ncbi:hypothetical protein [Dethiothermospora halolimnae]|uniref:hypothetical protein n=1 Tax=Dethiothermospora halolimnae TaxID=3114390 RepID=UPI003CCB99F7